MNVLMAAVLAAGVAGAAEVTVDFAKDAGTLRPALHSSGWTPRSNPRAIQNDDAAVKSLGMTYARTHDWALVNHGQRAVDYQYVFPLIDKDAADPSNYYFEATDHLLQLCLDVGLTPFYRLGTSIEHTGKVHFNAKIPADYDKVAEVFAATVRHYNRGWANGKKWDIKYWEIWNEPDGMQNMWCEEGRGWAKDEPTYLADAYYMRDKFVKFYVTCLKRLKSEFGDTIKVGGPALCWYWEEYFTKLLEGCKAAGVAPDFISWHYYGTKPEEMIDAAAKARQLCDSFGFTKTEIVIDEWHYLLTWDGIHGNNSSPEMVKRALNGPTGINQIDSTAFTLTSLAKFQTSKFDLAFFYGCGHQGNWGYMDEYKQYNKNYYACKLFGDLLKDYATICESASGNATVTPLAVKSADGTRAAALVTDYLGKGATVTVQVKGAAKIASVTAIDHPHDTPVELKASDYTWKDGLLTLKKSDNNSAAFLVKFER